MADLDPLSDRVVKAAVVDGLGGQVEITTDAARMAIGPGGLCDAHGRSIGDELVAQNSLLPGARIEIPLSAT